MNEIICPNCKKAFKVDEAGYASILKQVRDHQFDEEINNRLKVAEREKEDALKILESSLTVKLQGEISKKDSEILILKSKIDNAEMEKQLSVSDAVKNIEKERDTLANEIKNKNTEKELLEKSLKESYSEKLKVKDEALKLKDDEIDRLKDFKLKLSTKMIGESLEQHCEAEFNKLRSTAFQNAYFEKDNDSSSGTKGDYIFKEMDQEGNEILSIMFEMKNEGDETATKKKNEDFFDKLDKDRNQKKCEYAVLVSLLEADNEYYNTGIVDVSHKHSKMYVIRPQFFIQIISLLRNAAMNSLEFKAELARVKNQNIDITDFEEKLTKFKEGFAYNYQMASKNFDKSIDEIDKSISHLQKIKDALILVAKNLRIANDKADDITIKKLTHGNPTMKSKFDALNE